MTIDCLKSILPTHDLARPKPSARCRKAANKLVCCSLCTIITSIIIPTQRVFRISRKLHFARMAHRYWHGSMKGVVLAAIDTAVIVSSRSLKRTCERSVRRLRRPPISSMFGRAFDRMTTGLRMAITTAVSTRAILGVNCSPGSGIFWAIKRHRFLRAVTTN